MPENQIENQTETPLVENIPKEEKKAERSAMFVIIVLLICATVIGTTSIITLSGLASSKIVDAAVYTQFLKSILEMTAKLLEYSLYGGVAAEMGGRYMEKRSWK